MYITVKYDITVGLDNIINVSNHVVFLCVAFFFFWSDDPGLLSIKATEIPSLSQEIVGEAILYLCLLRAFQLILRIKHR